MEPMRQSQIQFYIRPARQAEVDVYKPDYVYVPDL